MSARGALGIALLGLVGCGVQDAAPPSLDESNSPELLFLVKNEVWTIRLDGTRRKSLGVVGDDRHRTAWPRLLPDQRIAVLGDDTGGIFPYVAPHEGGSGNFVRLTEMNVTLHDSLCGVTLGGATRLVLTTTPFLATHGTLSRVNPDNPKLEPIDHESAGVILNPAPYSDGRVLAVRVVGETATVEIIDVAGPAFQLAQAEVLATLHPPYLPAQPARLPDGRVVFIRYNPNGVSDSDIGEMFMINRDGSTVSTGITGVLALEAVGGGIVYEGGGATGVSDLVYTDFEKPSINVTNTPYISEHIGWSD
jgi:hypothetical protein